jgi:hypothetical protein
VKQQRKKGISNYGGRGRGEISEKGRNGRKGQAERGSERGIGKRRGRENGNEAGSGLPEIGKDCAERGEEGFGRGGV